MSIMYILIPVAAILTALGIYLFFWAVKTEQFDDLEKQGMSILFNDTKKEGDNKDAAEKTISENQSDTAPQSEVLSESDKKMPKN